MGEVVGVGALLADDALPPQLVQRAHHHVLVAHQTGPGRRDRRRARSPRRRPAISRAGCESCARRDRRSPRARVEGSASPDRLGALRATAVAASSARTVSTTKSGLPSVSRIQPEWRRRCRSSRFPTCPARLAVSAASSGSSGDLGELGSSRSARCRSSARSGCCGVDLLVARRPQDEQRASRVEAERDSAATPSSRGRTTAGRRSGAAAAVERRAPTGPGPRRTAGGRRTRSWAGHGQVRALRAQLGKDPRHLREPDVARGGRGPAGEGALRSHSLTGAKESRPSAA